MTTTTKELTLREHYSYNPATGLITNLKTNFVYNGTGEYIRVRYYDKNYMAHRLAWELFYGKEPTGIVDHINGNRSDNRIVNLREANPMTNAQNRQKANSNNSSGTKVPGVSFCNKHKKYRVTININGKQYFNGYYQTLEAAEDAGLAARRTLLAYNTL